MNILRFARTASLGASLIWLCACGTPGKDLPITEGHATSAFDGSQELLVKVESYYFEPSRIHVKVNKPVRLHLKSGTLLIPHNLSIHVPEAGIDVDQDIGSGDSTVVAFTPTRVGEYQIVCDKSGHADKGMVATLIVEP